MYEISFNDVHFPAEKTCYPCGFEPLPDGQWLAYKHRTVGCREVMCCQPKGVRQRRRDPKSKGTIGVVDQTSSKTTLVADDGEKHFCYHGNPNWNWQTVSRIDLDHYGLGNEECRNCGQKLLTMLPPDELEGTGTVDGGKEGAKTMGAPRCR